MAGGGIRFWKGYLMSTMLKLAVPNKGRLSERTLELLSKAGFHVPRHARRLLADVNGTWRLLFVRTDDIPEYVSTGTADVGITGLDVVSEHGQPVETLLALGFGKCRLAVAAPQVNGVNRVAQLQGQRVATVFPRLTRKFFHEKGVDVNIVPLSGATEVAPSVGVAEAVVDLVETGSTLRQNGLTELETVLCSEAVLIANKERWALQQSPILALQAALKSVLDAQRRRYLMANVPQAQLDAVKSLLPGVTAPTVMPLLGREDWVAVHAVIHEDAVNPLIPELKRCGVEGLLILPMERMVP